jgi:hypothetical protein
MQKYLFLFLQKRHDKKYDKIAYGKVLSDARIAMMRTDETVWIVFFLFFVHFEFISLANDTPVIVTCFMLRFAEHILLLCRRHAHSIDEHPTLLLKGTIIRNQVTFFKLFCILVHLMHLVTNGLRKMGDRLTELKSMWNYCA